MFGFRRMRLSVVLGIAVCCGLAASAKADLTFEAISDPIDSDSWMQAFQLTTDREFNYVGLFLAPLKNDVGSGFKENAWAFDADSNPASFDQVAVGNGLFGTSWAVAAGDTTTELVWLSHFRGTETNQHFSLTLFTFNDGLDWQGANARWDGTDWTFGFHTRDTEWQEFQRAGGVASVTPVPSAVVLGLLGLGIVGLIRRRFA